ncbi:MAG TPA: M28 family peptidase, partial [Tepidiformaceae bacterium]
LDMEEIQAPPGEAGLLGSAAMARAARREGRRYAAVYNLEMVGYSAGPGAQRLPPGFRLLFPGAYQRVRALGFRGQGLGVIGIGKGRALNRRLARSADTRVRGLDVVSVEVPSWLPIPDLLRSDHASFWLTGMPAVTLTDTGNFRNPHYHGPTDTPDTLDYRMLRQATQLLVATVVEHAMGRKA